MLNVTCGGWRAVMRRLTFTEPQGVQSWPLRCLGTERARMAASCLSPFVAMRGVKAGEELAYDWAIEENRRALTRCACGRPRCRGVLTGENWRKPEQRCRILLGLSRGEDPIHRARRRPRG